MIGRLRGILAEQHDNTVMIDVGGVGYLVAVPAGVAASLPAPGQEVTLTIHTHVREDAMELFGFSTPAQKQLFLLLTQVSGVGPKVGLAVLGALAAGSLVNAIITNDIKTLTKAPGVGRKLAERISLELKDKVQTLAGDLPDAASAAPAFGGDLLYFVNGQDLELALKSLGYKPASIAAVMRKMESKAEPDLAVEELVVMAMKLLAEA